MNRRDFLKMLGVGIAAPKLIFDMGKNSRLYSLLEAHPRFKIPYMTHPGVSDDTIYFVNGNSIELMEDHTLDTWAYNLKSIYKRIEIDKEALYRGFGIITNLK